MNREFTIDIGGRDLKIYMQSGFFEHEEMSYPLHRHSLPEVHLLLGGEAVLTAEEEETALKTGDVLVIPASCLHRYESFSADAKRISFFLELPRPIEGCLHARIPTAMLPLLATEIEAYALRGRDGKLRALLSYICSEFGETEHPITPLSSRELIIENFFSEQYNRPVTVDDLARELMLSKKQTEREVKRVTGKTFLGELSERRINAAILLSQSTDYTLSRISELVGYASYCGFYKAYQRVRARVGNGENGSRSDESHDVGSFEIC